MATYRITTRPDGNVLVTEDGSGRIPALFDERIRHGIDPQRFPTPELAAREYVRLRTMERTDQTSEPWQVSGRYKVGKTNVGDAYFCRIEGPDFDPANGYGRTPDQAERNAERIVACVNACAGIRNPESLRARTVQALREWLTGDRGEDVVPILSGILEEWEAGKSYIYVGK